VTEIKDTVREYSEYIKEAVDLADGLTNGVESSKSNQTDISDEEDEEGNIMKELMGEFDSIPYTDIECAIAQNCVNKMVLMEKIIKYCLGNMTTVNDIMEPMESNTPVISVFSHVDNISSTNPSSLSSMIASQNDLNSKSVATVSDVNNWLIILNESNNSDTICNQLAQYTGTQLVEYCRANTYNQCNLLKNLPSTVAELGAELHTPFNIETIKELKLLMNKILQQVMNGAKLFILLLDVYLKLNTTQSTNIQTLYAAYDAMNTEAQQQLLEDLSI
jgi:hypothetical protein